MELRVIRGLEQAKTERYRVDPADLDSLPEEVTDRTESVFGERLTPEQSVRRILQDVESQGDSAVRRYGKLLDGLEPESLEVTAAEIDRARAQLSPDLLQALELAASRVEHFHQATMRKSWVDLGSGLGELVTPIERVGVYAPGGTAAYPSTVLMTAVPARVAGVNEIVLASPPQKGGDLNPAVLAAASISGVDRVFRIGGVQAIGALAYGTESVPKVDKICGPGNIFVTLAKRMVFGGVDIDGLFGPTETVVIADETASPELCAADLLAQAEHDSLAAPILVTTSLALIGEVEGELERQLALLDRSEMAGASMEQRGKVILVDTLDEAVDLANHIAPEHLCMMIDRPWDWAGKVKHVGGLFLGAFSPEVMGDYIAGPSHVMPTGGSARFSSALSVHHFLRTVPVVGLKPETYPELAAAATTIANAEGLTGHARAVQARLGYLEKLGREAK